MYIKKVFYARRAVIISLRSGAVSSATVKYYIIKQFNNDGRLSYGICIEVIGKKVTEAYTAYDICPSLTEAHRLTKKLYDFSVFPVSADECIEEMLISSKNNGNYAVNCRLTA